MANVRLANRYTRRAALTMAAVAGWLRGQSPKTAPVVHFEIGCRDRAKTERFFADLFGWKMQQNGPATNIEADSEKGIPGHITALGHEPQHYTMFYVEVDDLQAYLDKAVALGGKIVVPPVKLPTGAFAWFSDIDGNVIGLLKK